MISRKYDKRIKVFEVNLTPNEFAGNTQSYVLLFTSWCEIETNNVGYKVADFGIDTFENPILFRCRFRNDFKWQGRTLMVQYKNENYTIKGIRNSGLRDLEMDIFCQRQEPVLPNA